MSEQAAGNRRVLVACTACALLLGVLLVFYSNRGAREHSTEARSGAGRQEDASSLHGVEPSRTSAERKATAPRGDGATTNQPASGGLALVFRDASTRAAVAGVEVHRVDELGRPERIGKADAEGRCELPSLEKGVRPDRPHVATAPGYAPRSFEADEARWEDLGQPHVLLLDPEEFIEGTVRVNDSLPVPSGVLAIAWPRNFPNPTQRSYTSLLDDPMIQWAEVAADGSFKISGVSPDTSYSVTAGGEGWATRQVKRGVHSRSKQPLVLTLGALYGTIIRLRSGDGADIALNAGYSGRGYGTASPDPTDASLNFTSWVDPQSALCLPGFDIASQVSGEVWIRVPMLVKGRFPDGAVPSQVNCQFEMALPGYGEVDLELPCHWTRQGLVEHVVEVPRDPRASFGRVRLNLDSVEELAMLGKNAQLMLRPDGDRMREMAMRRVGATTEGASLVWGGVPEGRYQAAFSGDVMAEPLAVRGSDDDVFFNVVPGGESLLEVTTSSWPVELRVTHHGEPYSGALSVKCTAEGRAPSRWLFESSPFVLTHVSAGYDTLEVVQPRFYSSESGGYHQAPPVSLVGGDSRPEALNIELAPN